MPVSGPMAEMVKACLVLEQIGITTWHAGEEWETTEIGKLCDTLRYGHDILFMRFVHDLCKKYGANFEDAYRYWTAAYNEGYANLSDEGLELMRPTMKPMPGPLAGHCVSANARLLMKTDPSDYAAKVIEAGNDDWPKA